MAGEGDATLDPILQAATERHLAGHLEQAAAGYRQVLALCPEHSVALHRFGILALQAAQPALALDLLQRATALDPAAWWSRCSLGQALEALGRRQEALAAFRQAAQANPDCLEAWLGRGAACRALGLGPEAIAAYQQAVRLRPELAEAENDLGIVLQDAGRLAEAIAAFQRALALRADFPLAHSNLGNALLLDGQVGPALALLEAAVARWPDCTEAWYNLGNTAFAANRFAPSAQAYRRALALVPEHQAARNNLGNVLQALGQYEAALDCYLEALDRDPDFLDAYNNASAAARTLGRMDQAAQLLRAALARHPESAVTHGNLGNLLKDIGFMEEAIQSFRQALALDPGDTVSHSNLAYSVCFLPGCSSEAILRENRDWDRAHARPTPPAPLRQPDPARRLRVGYVSPDFREHCQSLFTLPLLSHHDHERFEIVCYASVARPDAITRRIAGHADQWREVRTLDDAALAERVRADGIDILVDLTMHMANGRPGLFTRRPAPLQVAWLAYPGTTGLAAMDYRFTDPYLDPPGEHDAWYSERSIRLADTFWCYDPLTREPLPGPLPARGNGRITFGSLNNFCKVTPAVLALWAQVMHAVPDSRLLLLAQPGSHRQRVLELMGEDGIAPERIEFAPFRPRLDYLALYQRIDLGLDTFPYNGHTTSLDAFWMGVPVVTRLGATVVGRAGWSQLCNLDLRELAASSDQEFIRIASALARDLPRLAHLRQGLRARMENSPLMDGARFARSVEDAYRQIWQWRCRGEAL